MENNSEKNKCLIIGAGFSKNLGGPLLHECFPRGISTTEHIYPGYTTKFLTQWATLIGEKAPQGMDIEEIVTRIDVEITYRTRQKAHDHLIHSLWKLGNSAIQIFWNSVNISLDEGKIVCLDNFFRSFNISPLTIISFNQDLLLEHYFEKKEISWCYGFPVEKFTYEGTGEQRTEFPEIEFVSSVNPHNNKWRNRQTFKWYSYENPNFVLIKPHGSFNWIFCPRCFDVQILPLDDAGCLGRPIAPADGLSRLCAKRSCIAINNWQMEYANLIIPPSLVKEYPTGLMNSLRIKSVEALANTAKIVTFGYSFGEVDQISTWILYEACVKNENELTIIVVDPDKHKRAFKSVSTIVKYTGPKSTERIKVISDTSPDEWFAVC